MTGSCLSPRKYALAPEAARPATGARVAVEHGCCGGAFTQRMAAMHKVTLVAALDKEDAEESDAIVAKRQ